MITSATLLPNPPLLFKNMPTTPTTDTITWNPDGSATVVSGGTTTTTIPGPSQGMPYPGVTYCANIHQSDMPVDWAPGTSFGYQYFENGIVILTGYYPSEIPTYKTVIVIQQDCSKTVYADLPLNPPAPPPVVPPPVVVPVDPTSCEDARTTTITRKATIGADWIIFTEDVTRYLGVLLSTRDEFTFNSICWDYYEAWYRKANDEYNALKALYDLKKAEVVIWTCPDADWLAKFNAMKTKLDFLASLVDQLRQLMINMQKQTYVNPSVVVCPDKPLPEFRPRLPELKRNACYLQQGEFNAKYDALFAEYQAFVGEGRIQPFKERLYDTRDTFANDTNCYKYYNAWIVAVEAFVKSMNVAWGLKDKEIKEDLDCEYNDLYLADLAINNAVYEELKVMLANWKIQWTAYTDKAIVPITFSCPEKPTP